MGTVWRVRRALISFPQLRMRRAGVIRRANKISRTVQRPMKWIVSVTGRMRQTELQAIAESMQPSP